jgi:hypothetical protein
MTRVSGSFLFFFFDQVPHKERNHGNHKADRAERILAGKGEKVRERHRKRLHMNLTIENDVDPTKEAEYEEGKEE